MPCQVKPGAPFAPGVPVGPCGPTGPAGPGYPIRNSSLVDILTDELGFDVAIDYKTEDVRRALREAAPQGVDVYFDNVGGEILDAVLTRLARGARIVICGAVSQYNATEGVHGPSNYLALLVARASMTGMVVFDYVPRFGEAIRDLAGWMQEGRLVSREHVVAGSVSAFPDALLKLFAGENVGKLVLRLEGDDS